MLRPKPKRREAPIPKGLRYRMAQRAGLQRRTRVPSVSQTSSEVGPYSQAWSKYRPTQQHRTTEVARNVKGPLNSVDLPPACGCHQSVRLWPKLTQKGYCDSPGLTGVGTYVGRLSGRSASGLAHFVLSQPSDECCN